jgi:hypothetical protein
VEASTLPKANTNAYSRLACVPIRGVAPVNSKTVHQTHEVSHHPDVAWMKKHVRVLSVGHALGLQIHRNFAKCWRPENHRNGDAHPSLHFYERTNRVRCFVCDVRGGHSCIDLVMGVLGFSFGDAVNWIAERFDVPSVKPGRPVGSRAKEPQRYRVGIHGSELEVLVRSGMFGQLSPAQRSILMVLDIFRDAETGLTQLSYAGIGRYAGVSSSATISRSLKKLARLHAIEVHRGIRVGITRECSCYRATLEDEKFLARCNEVYLSSREEVAQERAYRHELRAARKSNRGGVLGPLFPTKRERKSNTLPVKV